jgi:3-keto-L-gulonate-6-phosphate decarboxylase
MEQTVSIYDKGKLLSLVDQLSARQVQAVILFAERLLTQSISDVGRTYIEMLLQEGADAAAIMAAVQAVRDVDQRLAQEMDSQAGLVDLYQRTEKHFLQWCRDRGINHETLSEYEFAELVEEAVSQVRDSDQSYP